MKFGFASSVKGIRPEARENAQEAARRAGLSLSDWLNAVILQQAATQGIRTSHTRANEEASAEDLSDVHNRLDDLTRRIDQVTRSGTAAYAPKRSREDAEQFTELFSRLEQRFDQIANAVSRPPATPTGHPFLLDRAVAGARVCGSADARLLKSRRTAAAHHRSDRNAAPPGCRGSNRRAAHRAGRNWPRAQ